MRLHDDNQLLRINQVRHEDAGLYTCTAENSLRRISASTDVRVRDPSWYSLLSLIIDLIFIVTSTAIIFSAYVKFNNV